MKTILTVIGARPQIIKSAALSRCIRTKYSSQLREIVVHTGQHYSDNMSALHFEQMGIPKADITLQWSHDLSAVGRLAAMIDLLGKHILDLRPDYVLVYGDTDSTLAAALAAELTKTPVAHVEAGLRSFRMDMPEERNRILTDMVARLLFAPTPMALEQLQIEMKNSKSQLFMTGDIMLDNAIYFQNHTQRPEVLKHLSSHFVLFTAHRADTMDKGERFAAMISCLEFLLEQHHVVWPMHPRTEQQMYKFLTPQRTEALLKHPRLTAIEPFGYLDTIWALKNAYLVCTDSGGLQKEAAFFGKQVLILRDETEWNELLDCGIATLTGLDPVKMSQAMQSKPDLNLSEIRDLFGKGNSAEIICDALLADTGN